MTKRTVFTTISPLPAGVSREVVLEFLHNHTEMIDLNPLVIERHFINPPKNVQPDEKNCVWYSMTDKIDYWPGGKVSGDVSYTCAFHDLPNGLQTHCRAPLGVDIRDKWTLNGSLPGEPPEPAELGIGAPASGLYIREDVDLKCNIFMARFVKKNLQKSHAALVDKLVARAHEISAQRRASINNTSTSHGGALPQLAVPVLSRPWFPPRYPPAQSHSRHTSSGASFPTQPSLQEPTSPSSTQSSTRSLETPQSKSIRELYNEGNLLQTSVSYRAPSQTSPPQGYFPSFSSPPALRMPSQHKVSAPPRPEYPPPIPPPKQPLEHPSDRYRPPYPIDGPPYPVDDDQDVIPAPLRIGGQDPAIRSNASTSTASSSRSRSRSNSDLEHPMYPHLSPYSPEFTDRSSSPDEPRTPESVRYENPQPPKGYLGGGGIDHPDVLKPGTWRPSGRLTGPYMAEY